MSFPYRAFFLNFIKWGLPPTLVFAICACGLGLNPLNQSGSSGGGGGASATNFNRTATFSNSISHIAAMNDGSGRVYAVGNFTHFSSNRVNFFTRVNSDGSLDSTFSQGVNRFNGSFNVLESVVLDPNSNGVYVSGTFGTYNGNTISNVARIRSDGSLDTGLNTGTGFTGNGGRVAIASNGDIYMSGFITSYNGASIPNLVRLNSDGSQDADFSLAGISFAGGTPLHAWISRDGSDDVYITGSFTSASGAIAGKIVRFNSDGTFDSDFDLTGGGFNGFALSVTAVYVLSDGSNDIYVSGSFTSYNGTAASRLVRLNSDGSIDSNFDVGTGPNNTIAYLAPAEEPGKILIAGTFGSYNGVTATRVARLHSDGSLDTSFRGSAQTSITEIDSAKDGTGSVYLSGSFFAYDSSSSYALARIDSTGAFAQGYGRTGIQNNVNAIVVATDGSGDLFVAGDFTQYDRTLINRICRLKSDGTLDTQLASNASVNSDVDDIAITEDGDIYAVGAFTRRIIRLNADGTTDGDFSVPTGLNSSTDIVSMSIDGSNDVYASGSFTSYNGTAALRIVRINSDGSYDSDFDSTSGANSIISAFKFSSVDPTQIYIGGYFTSYGTTNTQRLARLNSDGSVDTNFNTTNGVSRPGDGVLAIAPLTDGTGSLYIGGTIATYGGTDVNNIARLLSNGALDSDFDTSASGFNAVVRNIYLTTDGSGDIIVVGNFTSFGGTSAERIIRLNSDATVDTSFQLNQGGFGGIVTEIEPAGSDAFYVGGNFRNYRNSSLAFIGRIKSNGELD